MWLLLAFLRNRVEPYLFPNVRTIFVIFLLLLFFMIFVGDTLRME